MTEFDCFKATSSEQGDADAAQRWRQPFVVRAVSKHQHDCNAVHTCVHCGKGPHTYLIINQSCGIEYNILHKLAA
jgi:hypothetical protein